ncbi:MAG TPA: AI-2E family transporter [Verrucomicrobiae bacterium]|nr:AI-2E family transporter [Verrucomicrobiae bacterium]
MRDHARTTGSALKNWFVAQCYDSLAVMLIWLVGLKIIGVPWAPLWALIAGLLQFIPHFGPPVAVIFPALVGLFSSNHMGFFYVLILFAFVMVTDGFLLQPYFMKRRARVPFWASLFTPIALALLIPFWWALLLAPPLLAIAFAYWHQRNLGQADQIVITRQDLDRQG